MITDPITQMEEAIVARLGERLPGRFDRVEPFPAAPDQYDFAECNAVALVHYAGGEYGPAGAGPRTAYAAARKITWAVVLLVRSLRGSDGGTIGAYEALEEVRLALQGVSLAGATPLTPVRETLDEHKAGVWRWTLELTASLPALAQAQHELAPYYTHARQQP